MRATVGQIEEATFDMSGRTIKVCGIEVQFGLRTKPPYGYTIHEVAQIVGEAVQENERERCAKMVEDMCRHDGGEYVAELIRSGK